MNGASTPDVNGIIDIGNDLARIAGLLQEQAEEKSDPPGHREPHR
ncbi:hypothetical protein QMK19_40025 [Streptomyces sp. H10-C2]|nr:MULTISPECIES: hypothetical protein [unclassified Streptomyces]MDJ0347507.1 hypothetical protein [Streptomyces sp. PH10-H1]MDJ0375611.1 hypothetical protein [Streptomyces sp. H10-C2]